MDASDQIAYLKIIAKARKAHYGSTGWVTSLGMLVALVLLIGFGANEIYPRTGLDHVTSLEPVQYSNGVARLFNTVSHTIRKLLG